MRTVDQAYDEDPESEWRRLVKAPYQSLEFRVIMDRLGRYLPAAGRILDAGGGPGRYAIELCRLGYEVVLLDLSAGCLDAAREKMRSQPADVRGRLRDYVQGDVRDLSTFDDGAFDAVLCLDPLSYVCDAGERAKATSELLRVAAPGAPVCIAARGYLAVVRHILRYFREELKDPSFTQLVETGDTLDRGVPVHFFRAAELRALAEGAGLETVEMAGCEGLSSGLDAETNALAEDRDTWERWAELVVETASDTTLVDGAGHMLYVGRKHG